MKTGSRDQGRTTGVSSVKRPSPGFGAMGETRRFRPSKGGSQSRRIRTPRATHFSRRQRTNSQYFGDQDPFVALVDPLLLDHRAPRRLPVPEQLVEAAGADVGVGDGNTHAALAGAREKRRVRWWQSPVIMPP